MVRDMQFYISTYNFPLNFLDNTTSPRATFQDMMEAMIHGINDRYLMMIMMKTIINHYDDVYDSENDDDANNDNDTNSNSEEPENTITS